MVASGEPGHVVNTSSGNGGVVPFGDTAVYATTKAAVVTITESLYAHLLRAESIVRASVLFPGPNWLRTSLWDAWRWRPDGVREDRAPPDAVPVARPARADHGRARRRARVDAARRGRGDVVVRGIRAEQFWMLPPSDTTDDVDPRARRVDAGAREPDLLPRVEGTGEVNTERYTVISADGHAGASVPTYREYLASRLARRVRRVGADLQQPVRRSRRIERLPQLGLRRRGSPSSRPTASSPRCSSRTRSRRSFRRARSSRRRRTRPSTSTGGPGCRRTTAGWPTSARPHPAAARASRRSCSTTSTTPCAEVEFAHDAGLFGGVLLPGVPPNHEIPPLWSDVYEPLWARCEELGAVVNHHSGGGLPAFDVVGSRGARGDARRDPDLRAPRAVALIFAGVFERHPRPEVRAHRAGHELGAGHARQPRLVREAHAHHDARPSTTSAAPRSSSCRSRRASTSSATAGSARASCARSSPRCATRSASTASCGAATTRTPKARTRTAARRCAPRSPIGTGARGRARCARDTAAEVYGFDLDALDPIAARVGPTVAEIAEPLARVPGRLHLQRVRPRRHRPHLVNDRGTDQMSWVHDPSSDSDRFRRTDRTHCRRSTRATSAPWDGAHRSDDTGR